jgi:hypothetical protein
MPANCRIMLITDPAICSADCSISSGSVVNGGSVDRSVLVNACSMGEESVACALHLVAARNHAPSEQLLASEFVDP